MSSTTRILASLRRLSGTWASGLALILGAVPLASAGDALPRLEGGRHLSVLPHGYFEPPAPGTEATLDAQLGAVVQAGNLTASYELDWSELEPEKEVYDVDTFRAQLDSWRAQGLTRFYLNVSAISIETLGAPEDLIDPSDPDRFRDGMSIDDPVIVERYTKMLDAILPVFLEKGGFAFSAGNEINGYFEKYPAEADAYVNFLRAVREHVRTIASDLPVGCILTINSVLNDELWHVPILSESDFAGYNFYSLVDAGLDVLRDEAEIRRRIWLMVERARGLPVLIQEFGVPWGLDGVTEAEQADITRIMYEEVYDHPSIRWVSWFKMTDFSQLFADTWGALLLAQGESPVYVDKFKAWLRGSGLHVYETGAPRQAWETYRDALDRVALDVEGLNWASNEELSWESVERAGGYDVTRGRLSVLRSTGSVEDAVGLACGVTAPSVDDAEMPPMGDGFYHLVRARDGDVLGSWGRIARDGQIAACDGP